MYLRSLLWLWILGLILGMVPWLGAAEPANVAITVADDHVDFLVGKDLIGRYEKGPSVAKPYFWPVNGPHDRRMTRAWPLEKAQPGESTDHVHQKSFWFCHGDVIPEGLTLNRKIKGVEGVDFWSEAPGHGRIVCVHVYEPRLEKNHGHITTYNEWRTSDGAKILDEARTIHFYDLGAARPEKGTVPLSSKGQSPFPVRLFVFNIDLQASAVPITFGDTKEGSFGIRINDTIREEIVVNKKKTKGPGKIENAEGKVGEQDCWGYVSAWCDYSGPIDGKLVGLAILDDPKNPYPACWHSRGYGLMAANPFGRAKSGFPAMKGKTELVKLAKGEHLKLRYGLLIHPGDAKEGKVADYFQQFVKLREG